MFKTILGAAVAVSLLAGSANAVTYKITNMINSSADGFRSTLFHATTGCSSMCGAIYDKADGSASGKWNPHTDAIDFTFGLIGGGSVQANGWLDFDNPVGGLVGKIAMTISGSLHGNDGTYDMEFRDWMYMTAAGVNDFRNDVIGLWGASGGTQNSHNGGFSGAKMGGDFRIQVSAVPVPAALPLLGAALAGLGLMGTRRRKSNA